MMDSEQIRAEYLPEESRIDAGSSSDWLTVSEAVAFCELNRLSRTPKTVRKWAHRSHQDPENGEIIARREDVDNGFRWVIERSSLLRKIEQELEFEARRTDLNDTEPVQTGRNAAKQVGTSAVNENVHTQTTTPEEPERTDLNPSAPVQTSACLDTLKKTDENPSELAQTGSNRTKPERSETTIVEQLQARIKDLKSEVEFYRDELKDRRHTTLALTDVIEAFRLTAATNASRAQERSDRRSHDIRPQGKGDSWQSENTSDAV